MSDTTGNLLVYFTGANGVAYNGVRSADHQLIAANPPFDGDFFGLTQQYAIFIPKPGDPERAYLIAWNRIPIVETHRFGLLEVFLGNDTEAPQVLTPEYTWFMTGAACKRMVVPHANGVDYWFVGQMEGTNAYHAYLISNEGLSISPVISTAGTVIPPDFNFGKLIPTVDGNRFASVSETLNYEDQGILQPSITEIHSFDPGTGEIQHQLTLDAPVRMDGVEFSPSGRFLYVRHWLFANPVVTHQLYQYDLEAADPNASPALMDSYLAGGLSGPSTNILCHAPDGRVYVSHYTQSLGLINEPDLPFPQCAYAHDGFLASDGPPGLPSFIKRYHDDPVIGPLRINDHTAIVPATVVPNPLSGTGELRWSGAAKPLALQWMDAQGRVVRSGIGTTQGTRIPLDAGGLAAGHYLLRVQALDEAPVVVRVNVVH